jgi:predicted MFS family arabinose efflux permease
VRVLGGDVLVDAPHLLEGGVVEEAHADGMSVQVAGHAIQQQAVEATLVAVLCHRSHHRLHRVRAACGTALAFALAHVVSHHADARQNLRSKTHT